MAWQQPLLPSARRAPVPSSSGGADPVGDAVAAPAVPDSAFRALIEADALDVLRLGADGSLLEDLPGLRRLTGREVPLHGLDWLSGVVAEDRVALRDLLRPDGPVPRLRDIRFRLRLPDGGSRRLAARLLGLPGPDGRVAEWIGRIDDVTDAAVVADRSAALARASEALARTVTVEDVVACVEDVLLDVVGAASCGLYGTDPDDTDPPPLLLSRGYDAASDPPAVGSALGMVLPLRTSTAPVGAWHLIWPEAQEVDASRRAFLDAVAVSVAQALSRAQLYEQTRSTARLFQRSLMPDRLPPVPGLEVAARYRSATGSDVGGDWYDVLQLADGRAGLVLGDVMGRGVRAATTMAQVRNALRGIAVVDPTPVGMLAGLDRFFSGFGPDEITTLVITVIDTATGALHVGNAGHLPPLLLRADGRSGQLDDGASTPLGVPTDRVACKGTTLLPGDLLVMCSDGLVERRDWSVTDGLAVLEAAARRLADRGLPIEQLADELLHEVLDGCPTDDDVSLLVVRVPA